jgi:hypothetical protein
VVGREQKRQKTTADEHEILEDRHETPRHPLPIEAGVTTGKSGKRSSTSSHYTALCDCSPATAGDKTAIAIAWRFGMSIETADAAASRAWETYRLINRRRAKIAGRPCSCSSRASPKQTICRPRHLPWKD